MGSCSSSIVYQSRRAEDMGACVCSARFGTMRMKRLIWYQTHFLPDTYQTLPRREGMQCDGDGFVRLTLGDGEFELPVDSEMRQLCLAIHKALCPLSPHDAYECVISQHHPEVSRPRESYRVLVERSATLRGCADCPESLCDVAPCIVSEFWSDDRSDTFGHPRTTLRFETPEQAREAQCLYDEFNCGTARDVVRLICQSQNRHSLLHVFEAAGIRQNWTVDDCADHVTTGMWSEMTHPTTDVRAFSVVCVVHEIASTVYTMVFVHHHWVVSEHDPTYMQHRSIRHRGWGLRYIRQAPHGGHIRLETPSEELDAFDVEEWPLWMSDVCKRWTRAPRSTAVSLELPLQRYASAIKRKVDIDTIDCDVKCRKVIAKWSKSQSAEGVNAPFLVRVRPLHDDGTFHSGGLNIRREFTEAEVRQSSLLVFADRFGAKYAEGIVSRCCNDDSCAIYSVYDGDTLVGAFSMVIYDSVSSSGCSSVCAMVDSFAVFTSMSGRNYGGRMFHDGVRHVARKHAGTAAYTVFAQCVRTGDAQKFWFDKLDDSSAARSLMLQALSLDGLRVPVQSEAQCTPRCREYRS